MVRGAKCDCVMVCSRNTQCARRKRFRVRVRTYYVCVCVCLVRYDIVSELVCDERRAEGGPVSCTQRTRCQCLRSTFNSIRWTEDWVISPVEWIFSEIVDTTRLAKNDDRGLRIVCILRVHVGMTNQFGCVSRDREWFAQRAAVTLVRLAEMRRLQEC